ncbi:hypothetical protein FUAX_34360 [Fulvitalea axinellae]|uniref:MnmC-like methyltransferase domain-containing protein n=2 Tax=Fulvitalea axinellae TaxID=1182444 RepID=A0AAU9CWY6_9BACT|nr:hypothetical protein FUAX_34360 [Fulvitalea axinellae]
MPTVNIIETEDGSHSLFVPELDETYHSSHGAVNESIHVFIKAGIEHFVANNPGEKIRILEVGFGTGLNALLTAQKASESAFQIEYHTLEAFPLDEDIVSTLNYPEKIGGDNLEELFQEMHAQKWGKPFSLSKNMTMLKTHAKLQATTLEDNAYDLVYFDAFAPSKQSDMWTLDVLKKVADSIAPGGSLVTYCARGQFKRDLKALGLDVESLPGPPPKKEMVRASRTR